MVLLAPPTVPARYRIAISVVALVVLAIAGYVLLRPDFCDGIPREMGGCDADRATFSGTTCDEVADEWGRQLDERVLAVVNGPKARGGNSQSVLLHNVETVTSHSANKHLRESGLTPECELERFFTVGEAQFSEELRSSVGLIMYQGNPVTDYDEWRERAKWWIGLILSDPDVPYEGA